MLPHPPALLQHYPVGHGSAGSSRLQRTKSTLAVGRGTCVALGGGPVRVMPGEWGTSRNIKCRPSSTLATLHESGGEAEKSCGHGKRLTFALFGA